MELYIKNMVCPRCILAVRAILDQLQIDISHIQLGLVITPENITESKLDLFRKNLAEIGFELLDNLQKKLVEQIKAIIIDQIYQKLDSNAIVSELLSQQLNKDYSHLSKLFSSTEGVTIEQYTILQKVEHIKELLSYNESTLSEIAFQMGYSSVAHISTQFKKVTGMTPSQFKEQAIKHRKSIDTL